jgi:hypothetical protein
MNLKNSWMAKTASFLSMSAAAVVMGLPAIAGPAGGGAGGFNNYANPFSPADSSNASTTDSGYGNPNATESSRREADYTSEQIDSDMNRSMPREVSRDMQESGPSDAPNQSYPGPSESPSGSPSVPGTSTYDDPGLTERGTNQDTFDQSRDSRDRQPGSLSPDTENMDSMDQEGPSNAPDQSVPGPSESPSGSPSVDGTSNQDNPDRVN